MSDRKSFFMIPDFAESSEINRALEQIEEFYLESKRRGLFVSAEECSKPLDSSTYVPKLTSKNGMSYNEMAWFFDSITFKKLTEEVMKLLGFDVDMFMARVLITVPLCDIPDYIKEKILPVEGKLHGSLGNYIKNEFARASFFAYNPWHNDAIDFQASDCYFLNVLFPLTPRNNGRAPLSFVPLSQQFGKIPQPFTPEIQGGNFSIHHLGKEHSFPIETPDVKIGDLMMWHAFVIHNVDLNTSQEPAIGLRFSFNPSYRKNGVRDLGHVRPISRSWVSEMTENYSS